MHYIFFIRLSASGHLGCFHVSTVVNSAAANVEMQMYRDSDLNSIGCVLRRGLARVLGPSD